MTVRTTHRCSRADIGCIWKALALQYPFRRGRRHTNWTLLHYNSHEILADTWMCIFLLYKLWILSITFEFSFRLSVSIVMCTAVVYSHCNKLVWLAGPTIVGSLPVCCCTLFHFCHPDSNFPSPSRPVKSISHAVSYKWSTKITLDVLPTHPVMLHWVNNLEIWPWFSTPVITVSKRSKYLNC